MGFAIRKKTSLGNISDFALSVRKLKSCLIIPRVQFYDLVHKSKCFTTNKKNNKKKQILKSVLELIDFSAHLTLLLFVLYCLSSDVIWWYDISSVSVMHVTITTNKNTGIGFHRALIGNWNHVFFFLPPIMLYVWRSSEEVVHNWISMTAFWIYLGLLDWCLQFGNNF